MTKRRHTISRNALNRSYVRIGTVTVNEEDLALFLSISNGRGIAIRYNDVDYKFDIAVDILYSQLSEKFTLRVFNTGHQDILADKLYSRMKQNADKVATENYSELIHSKGLELFKPPVTKEQLERLELRRGPSQFLTKCFESADKQEALCKSPPQCPECNTKQVQLVSWIDPVSWKCRKCNHKWIEVIDKEKLK